MMLWIVLSVSALLLVGLYGFLAERRNYNNGICRRNGEPWQYFDTDSQGGRGYKSGEYVTWVSWPGIDGR